MERTIRRASSTAITRIQHQLGEFSIGDSFLRYRLLGEGAVLDLHQTVVVPADRRQNIAAHLCEAAFAHARESGLKVLPSCSYVRDRFIPQNESRLGNLALSAFDSDTPGLHIYTSVLGVASLRLTDARRRNPLTLPVLDKLRTFLRECAAMEVDHGGALPRVRMIAVEAVGPVFSAGHDFRDFSGRSEAEQRVVLDVCAEVNTLLKEVPQITIAAVSGAALAGAPPHFFMRSQCDTPPLTSKNDCSVNGRRRAARSEL